MSASWQRLHKFGFPSPCVAKQAQRMRNDELARNSANRPLTRRFDDRAVSYWISKFGSKIRHIDREPGKPRDGTRGTYPRIDYCTLKLNNLRTGDAARRAHCDIEFKLFCYSYMTDDLSRWKIFSLGRCRGTKIRFDELS